MKLTNDLVVCMKIIKEWEKDGVSYRLIYNEKNTSLDSDYKVQSKRSKNWTSFNTWYGMNILGDYLTNEQTQM